MVWPLVVVAQTESGGTGTALVDGLPEDIVMVRISAVRNNWEFEVCRFSVDK